MQIYISDFFLYIYVSKFKISWFIIARKQYMAKSHFDVYKTIIKIIHER